MTSIESARQFKTPGDLESLSNYVANVVASFGDFSRVVGTYTFVEQIPCALHHCRKMHNAGYAILLKDQRHTNIGNVCGRKAFGAAFTISAREVDREIERRRLLSVLDEYRAQEPALRARLQLLNSRPMGIRGVEAACAEFGRAFPSGPRGRLYERASRRDDRVFEERQRTAAEIATLRAMGTNMKEWEYEAERIEIGRLLGLPVLIRSASDIARERIVRPLVALATINASTQWREIAAAHRALAQIDSAFAEIQEILEQGRQFFTQQNFSLLKHLALSPKEKVDLAQFKWDHTMQKSLGIESVRTTGRNK